MYSSLKKSSCMMYSFNFFYFSFSLSLFLLRKFSFYFSFHLNSLNLPQKREKKSLNLLWAQPAKYIHITMFDSEYACLLSADE